MLPSLSPSPQAQATPLPFRRVQKGSEGFKGFQRVREDSEGLRRVQKGSDPNEEGCKE